MSVNKMEYEYKKPIFLPLLSDSHAIKTLVSVKYIMSKNHSILFTLWASDFASGYDPTGRFQLRPNKSGKPMTPHLLCCQGLAVF
jgi:hypothetical protein